MLRTSSFFLLASVAASGALFAAIAAIGLIGCNAQLATVLSSEDSGSGSSTDGGAGCPSCNETGTSTDGGLPTNDCASFGGVCLPQGQSAPPNSKIADPGQGTCSGTDVCWVQITSTPTGKACEKDPDCNPAPNLSSLHGHCFYGICVCDIGTVQPNGKCGPTVTECKTQGGTCHQQPATCPNTKIASDQPTNMTCGDFIEAVCCHDGAKCKGPAREVAGGGMAPVDFVCCAPNDAARPPICANGWKTCPAGHTPVDKAGGGGCG